MIVSAVLAASPSAQNASIAFTIRRMQQANSFHRRRTAYTKNVIGTLRSDETTNAAVHVFGKAETPPALWRRGAQPGSKNGSRLCNSQNVSGELLPSALLFMRRMSQVPFGAVKRVVEGAAPYRRGCPRFRQSRNAARTLAARGTAGEQKRIPFLSRPRRRTV